MAFSTIIVYAQLKLSFFKIPGLEVAYPVSLEFANIIFVSKIIMFESKVQ